MKNRNKTVQNIERLKLDAAHILPLHGRMLAISQLYTAVGKRN